MNDFDYEVKQRKALIYGARHKKNGSKSKYCGLPSDHLSAAELKRRNGKVETYNIGKPMSWSAFTAAPVDLQKEYIKALRWKFNASDAKLASMFGCGRASLLARMDTLGLSERGQHRVMTAQQLADWADWTRPDDGIQITTSTPEPEPDPEPVQKVDPTPMKMSEPKAELTAATLALSGSPAAVCEKLFSILAGMDTIRLTAIVSIES